MRLYRAIGSIPEWWSLDHIWYGSGKGVESVAESEVKAGQLTFSIEISLLMFESQCGIIHRS